MIAVEIDTGHLDALRRGWSPASHKALGTAFKAEAFRLRQVATDSLRQGRLGLPGAAPLTEAERRTPAAPPLGGMAGYGGRRSFVGYQVDDDGYRIEAKIGFGRGVTRARNPRGRRRQLVQLFGGATHTITRADQERIARKLRKRLGEPVRRRRLKSAAGRRKSRARGIAWADLDVLIPAVGTVVRWPERDWVAVVVGREQRNSVANIAALYAAKLRGEGFRRRWWDSGGRFAG